MYTPPLTLGIEEEYQIIDPETRGLTSYVQQMLNQGRVVLGDQLKPEFMEAQIEVGSHICRNIKEVRREVIRLRRTVCDIAQENGKAIVAASTHPFSRWSEQHISEGKRYKDLETHMQEVGRRMLIFGMHVHVGFGTTPEALELLIDIQNQMRYFLPHILALTTSSPFWIGRDTGLKSYRSIIFENLPRTGLPPRFDSFSEYREFVQTLGHVGSLDKSSEDHIDDTKIWWDTRPAVRFGTLEIRVADLSTKIDETVAIVALIQAIVAKLIKLRNQNLEWRNYRNELIAENKWRALRYGMDGKLIDFGKMEEVPMRFLAEELLEILDDVVDELESREEIEYIHTIIKEGTSADRQLRVYRKALNDGATEEEALHAVVDHLIAETRQGI